MSSHNIELHANTWDITHVSSRVEPMNPGLPRLRGNSHQKFVIMSIHGAPNGAVSVHGNFQVKWKQGTGYENI